MCHSIAAVLFVLVLFAWVIVSRQCGIVALWQCGIVQAVWHCPGSVALSRQRSVRLAPDIISACQEVIRDHVSIRQGAG